ncbi:hypothetical protein F511_45892 [Dorcoceras hygrometricum]|uniref:Uncharacterized protein n=1 Tax=Dorcoceras hygrometricum TaxID=472368 RepID=A0A2Z6ZVD6_9LAMI|nr:hypothetical protein F511_45892 [Dorcoceras hygrometricum]
MRGGADAGAKTCCFDSEIKTLDTIQANHIDQIRENLGSDTTVGDPDPPPGCFSVLPRWHLCLAPTGVSRTRRFSVDCGSYANPVHDQIRDSFVRLH